MQVSRTAFAAVQAGVPVVLVGEYGIGKTSISLKFAEFVEREVLHFKLVGARTEDLIGYPSIVETNGQKFTKNIQHEWVSLLQEKPCIVIFDDVSRVDEYVQNAIAQFLDKELGQYKISNNTWFLLSMNKYGQGTYMLNENLISRCIFYECDTDAREEERALLTGVYNTEAYFKKIPNNWNKFSAEARALLLAFYKKRPSIFRDTANKTRNSPWVCPRAIHRLTIPALAASFSCGYRSPEDIRSVLTAGLGSAFAEEFISWYVNRDLPDVEVIIQNLISDNHEFFSKYEKDAALFISIFTEVYTYLSNLQDNAYAEQIVKRAYKVLERIESTELVSYCLYLFKQRFSVPMPYRLTKVLEGIL